MASETVKKYINMRYERWYDRAKFLCTKAGRADEAGDVLNEVLADILSSRSNTELDRLYQRDKGKLKELDLYILTSIRLNVQSKTGPYNRKYHREFKSDEVDMMLWRERLIDNNADEQRLAEEQRQTVLQAALNAGLTTSDYCLFEFIMQGKSLDEWIGAESQITLLRRIKKIAEKIKRFI
jgi:hypothetical protein